jgi:hypothetical protein
MPPAVATLNIGVGPCWGETCGDMLDEIERIATSQPNEAMARIASRRNGSLDVDSKLFSKVQIDSKRGLG